MNCIKQISLILLCLSLATPGIALEPSIIPKGLLRLEPYPAPSIELADLDGKPYSLKQEKGAWVFVHFWASWCRPCRDEMPAIQSMINTLQPEGLSVAVINTAEDEDTVFSFLSAYAPNVRPLMDRDGQVTEQWQPRGLPATYLIDPDGQVRYQALGGRAWNTPSYLNFLRDLLTLKEGRKFRFTSASKLHQLQPRDAFDVQADPLALFPRLVHQSSTALRHVAMPGEIHSDGR